MKKITTALSLLLSIVYGYSQNIVLLDDNKNVISNTIVDVSIAPSSNSTLELLVKNSGSSPDTIKVVRTIYSVDGADQTQFCWGGLCYLYTTNTSSLSLTIAPGDTVNYAQNGFHAIFNAGTASVTRLIHYKFYNMHNYSDSTGVTLRYLSPAGINELSEESGILANAYPNPANSLISVKYDINGASEKGKIIFYDMLGKSVKEIILNDKQGIAKINISDLNAGIYFYTLMTDDKAISTKKLVVSR